VEKKQRGLDRVYQTETDNETLAKISSVSGVAVSELVRLNDVEGKLVGARGGQKLKLGTSVVLGPFRKENNSKGGSSGGKSSTTGSTTSKTRAPKLAARGLDRVYQTETDNETLAKISSVSGVDVSELVRLNDVEGKLVGVRGGQKLKLGTSVVLGPFATRKRSDKNKTPLPCPVRIAKWTGTQAGGHAGGNLHVPPAQCSRWAV
jgi:LysM repeat protein